MLGAENQSLPATGGQSFETSVHSALVFCFHVRRNERETTRQPTVLLPPATEAGAVMSNFPANFRWIARRQARISFSPGFGKHQTSVHSAWNTTTMHGQSTRYVSNGYRPRFFYFRGGPCQNNDAFERAFVGVGNSAVAGLPDTSTYPATFLFKCLEADMQVSRLPIVERNGVHDSMIIQGCH